MEAAVRNLIVPLILVGAFGLSSGSTLAAQEVSLHKHTAAEMSVLHSGARVPSSMAQEWMPRRPPMYTTRVSPDTNSAIAHAEAQDAPGFTTVRIPPRASMFAAIASASPTKPPGLSSSNVSNLGSAANFVASPFSIGPDARTVNRSRQMKFIAFGRGTAASKKAAAIAIRLNIPIASRGAVCCAIYPRTQRPWQVGHHSLDAELDTTKKTAEPIVVAQGACPLGS